MNRKNILIGIGAALATLAAIFFLRSQKGAEEKPPRKAPQLDLQNPGDQSEFTTNASASEVG